MTFKIKQAVVTLIILHLAQCFHSGLLLSPATKAQSCPCQRAGGLAVPSPSQRCHQANTLFLVVFHHWHASPPLHSNDGITAWSCTKFKATTRLCSSLTRVPLLYCSSGDKKIHSKALTYLRFENKTKTGGKYRTTWE